jgi:hypothetical protein
LAGSARYKHFEDDKDHVAQQQHGAHDTTHTRAKERGDGERGDDTQRQ